MPTVLNLITLLDCTPGPMGIHVNAAQLEKQDLEVMVRAGHKKIEFADAIRGAVSSGF